MRYVKSIMELLFPPKCILCGRLLPESAADLCAECRRDAPYFPALAEKESRKQKLTLRFLDSYTAVWYYEEKVRESILRYKFHKRIHLLPGLAAELTRRIALDYGSDFDMITWVPIHPIRRFFRTYDQSELLCRAVAENLGAVQMRTLRKVRYNRPQSSMEHSGRRANVMGVYRAVEPERYAGKRILLIDDVVTTGSTADECAMTLLSAGAGSVRLAVLAAAQKKKNKTKDWMI